MLAREETPMRGHPPFPLLALTALTAVAVAQKTDDQQAAADFQRAEKAVFDGNHERAVSIYREIARKYAATGWGKAAAIRAAPTAYIGWGDLHRTGPSSNRLDVVIMGDGYRLGDQNDFEDVARATVDVFRQHKLFGEYFEWHTFVRANCVSKDQGVSGFGREKDTALGGFIAGKVQGQVGVDRGKCQAVLEQLPEHDGYAIAIVKAGSMGTGGGGIAAVGGRADDTMLHEWGHAFGGLSDEYSTFTGHRGSPRSTINVSATDDLTQVPWKHWIEAKIPGIGAYRGADGRIKGAWKPTSGGCAMEGGVMFCPVCREALVLAMYRRVDPIDACGPDPKKPLRGGESLRFEVTVLRPKTHDLDVRWHVLPQQKAIAATDPGPFADRGERGPLAAIAGDGDRSAGAGGRHTFTVHTRSMQPGRYQVVCRVKDDAKPSGQEFAWVLEDDRHLLQSERVWLLEITP
jgi:hypothetical protein